MRAYRPFLIMLPGAVTAALLTSTRVASADELPPGNVLLAVETWVQRVTADARPDAVVDSLEPWLVEGRVVAHIAHLQDGGYCLCGADDRVLPVYLYVPGGEFDPESPTNRYVLNEIAGRTAALRAADRLGVATTELQAQLADRAAYWGDLIAGQAPSPGAGTRSAPSQMVLPLTSTWNQGLPYNDDCPNLTLTEQTVTGCVATATAQVMYYWQWPPTGAGQSSMNYHVYFRVNWDSEPLAADPAIPQVYPWWPDRLRYNAATHRLEINGYWDDSVVNAAVKLAPNNAAYQTALTALFNRIGQLDQNHTVNHAATAYNFADMRDSVSDPLDGASAAVARLMYHAGTACLMHWGILGSNTGNVEKVHALRDNFRYDSDIVAEPRDRDLITQDIQWFRPVTLGGDGPSGGHDWVVVGYSTATDPNRQFYMNFGWGGASNGWYTFDAVNTANGSFNNNQYHVRRIAPDTARFVDTGGSGDGTPSSPYGSLNQALQQAPDNTTLVFKAGSLNTYGSVITINRPLTLKGYDAKVQP